MSPLKIKYHVISLLKSLRVDLDCVVAVRLRSRGPAGHRAVLGEALGVPWFWARRGSAVASSWYWASQFWVKRLSADTSGRGCFDFGKSQSGSA